MRCTCSTYEGQHARYVSAHESPQLIQESAYLEAENVAFAPAKVIEMHARKTMNCGARFGGRSYNLPVCGLLTFP